MLSAGAIASSSADRSGLPRVHVRQPDVSIIVPTLREALNIPALVLRVFAATANAHLMAELIIVDDNSRDGTAALVDRLARWYPLRLVVRMDRPDLSAAVVAGFHAARGRLFLVMDADLSHPPEAIPRLVAPIAQGDADFAIGSRYIKGGRVENWPLHRRLASRLAALLASPLVPLRDPLSGFFCLSRQAWQRAGPLPVTGYKIALELLARIPRCRLVEVPITFTQRRTGSSKLGPRQQCQYLAQLWRLYRLPRRTRRLPC